MAYLPVCFIRPIHIHLSLSSVGCYHYGFSFLPWDTTPFFTIASFYGIENGTRYGKSSEYQNNPEEEAK
jgi:hypothetical protein